MLEVSIILLAISLFIGTIAGIIAGLLPGVHVNNTSAVLLGLSPSLVIAGLPPLYIAIMIIASTISQSFFDMIPAIFLGAPEDSTALATMPGHRLMLAGKGIEAVRLSAMGSGLSIAISLLLLLPLAGFFMIFYPAIQENMAIILILISIFILLSNNGHGAFPDIFDRFKQISWALTIFVISGMLGVIAFSMESELDPFIRLGEPEMLLPLLSGLFGAPALIISLNKRQNIPRQADKSISTYGYDILKGAALGTAAGSIVSWFPGVSSGVATTITGIFSKGRDEDSDRVYLISSSGVNTSNAIFSLVALFIIMKPRSGAVAAAQELLGGTIDLITFILFLMAICFTGIISYFMALMIGSYAAGIFSRIDYGMLNKAVLCFLVIMCLSMTGILGLSVYLISTIIGMASYFIEVRKTCLMGVLLVPCILYFL